MVRRLPWERLMNVDQTLAVQCIVGEGVSRKLLGVKIGVGGAWRA
jgi:hypothetical protein